MKKNTKVISMPNAIISGVSSLVGVREKVFSNMTERHNLAAGFIKQAVEEMNSDNVPESQNDKSFNDMMNDLDMLSEEK